MIKNLPPLTSMFLQLRQKIFTVSFSFSSISSCHCRKVLLHFSASICLISNVTFDFPSVFNACITKLVIYDRPVIFLFVRCLNSNFVVFHSPQEAYCILVFHKFHSRSDAGFPTLPSVLIFAILLSHLQYPQNQRSQKRFRLRTALYFSQKGYVLE